MAQQVVIAGALFNDVPSISVPDSNNVWHPFLDTTIASNAAAASDIAQGKLAYVNGSLVTGTASGGGGGGLEYETGTWTPESDISVYWITFSNSHADAPFYYVVFDATGTYDDTAYSNYLIEYLDVYRLSGNPYYVTSSQAVYARYFTGYRTNSATVIGTGGGNVATPGSSSYATNEKIYATTSSSSRYWRAGRTYKWIAVWAPTS